MQNVVSPWLLHFIIFITILWISSKFQRVVQSQLFRSKEFKDTARAKQKKKYRTSQHVHINKIGNLIWLNFNDSSTQQIIVNK